MPHKPAAFEYRLAEQTRRVYEVDVMGNLG